MARKSRDAADSPLRMVQRCAGLTSASSAHRRAASTGCPCAWPPRGSARQRGLAFSAIKRKFGAAVRSKHFTAKVNEVLLKVLCYNLSVLTHSIYELGVAPRFGFSELAAD